MNGFPSRRELLTQAFPGAALAGAGLAGSPLFAQVEAAQRPAGQAQPIVAQLLQQAYQNGEYTLPPLPYDYDALEPHIDAQTMRLHHDVHHQGYVNGLNSTLATLAENRGKQMNAAHLEGLQRNLSFNGGGHLLHTIFWATMAPRAGGQPAGAIAEAINRSFGSFQDFQSYFSSVATSVKGSGWAILAYEPLGDNLVVFGLNDQDLRTIVGAQPLLPLDVWEHAYYLKYQSKRADYVKAWWNVVNWSAVGDWYQISRARFHGQQQARGQRNS